MWQEKGWEEALGEQKLLNLVGKTAHFSGNLKVNDDSKTNGEAPYMGNYKGDETKNA